MHSIPVNVFKDPEGNFCISNLSGTVLGTITKKGNGFAMTVQVFSDDCVIAESTPAATGPCLLKEAVYRQAFAATGEKDLGGNLDILG